MMQALDPDIKQIKGQYLLVKSTTERSFKIQVCLLFLCLNVAQCCRLFACGWFLGKQRFLRESSATEWEEDQISSVVP